jgi:hypothetical protein
MSLPSDQDAIFTIAAKKIAMIGTARTAESHTDNSANICRNPKQIAQQIMNITMTEGNV